MLVVPVLDLLNRVVVRAVGGRRREYAPVSSRLSASSAPGDVAAAFAHSFGCREFYVADLSAIEGAEPDWDAYRAIARQGVVHVDCGAKDADDVARMIESSENNGIQLRPVIGLESLRDAGKLPEIGAAGRPFDIAFSLDLRNGRPIARCAAWADAGPLDIVDQVLAAGFQRLIVLDLSHVGAAQGVGTLPLCAEIRRRHTRLAIWAGGGIAGVADLHALHQAGCDGALVASVMHDGRLTVADVQQAGLLGRR